MRVLPSLRWQRRPGKPLWQVLRRHGEAAAGYSDSRGGESLARRPRRWPDSLVTLAIETSCDDTCVAVLEKKKGEPGGQEVPRARLLWEERVTADNRQFGGIHPLTATESHMAALAAVVQRATARLPAGDEGGVPKPDFVSVTRGPGMASSLATGLAVAKGLAVAWDVPLVGVHHMQAHALTPRLVAATASAGAAADAPLYPRFPYLSLLVSGGHTLLVHSRGLADHRVVAAADNIALGDLLDKSARAILPRGYITAAEARAGRSLPYGALLEAYGAPDTADAAPYAYPARRRDEMAPFESGRGWRLLAPLGNGALRKALRYDFAALNGAVLQLMDAAPDTAGMADDERRLVARGTMQLAFEHVASRLVLALETGAIAGDAPSCLVVSGGVASNHFLRRVLRSALDVRGHAGLPLVAPPPALCTDNAAMIAWTGAEMFEAGWQTALDVLPVRKWSMDVAAADGGILGLDGWVPREA